MQSSLPIYAVAKQLVDALRYHRILVVEGSAGCGKTTQLPLILKEAGLIRRCMGITQPRRIAAVSVAERMAHLLGQQVGEEVGYGIRFDDCTSSRTCLKIMTDGLLLQELRSDPLLSAYDIIMVDEAHERSLNIDFTLGLLYRLAQQRPTLRLIVSSATLHPGAFQSFFAGIGGEVPLITIPGREHPLTINYAPPAERNEEASHQAMAAQLVEISQNNVPGHVLVFLPGEGSILKLQQQLALLPALRQCEVLPLFGRLPRAEQERIFADYGGKRKIILTTNLAETSITVDGVAFVLDSGLCKLPWHDPQRGLTSLREMPISQAAATQRAGRAGRTGPGHVYRFYSEAQMKEAPPFTPEEIGRISLSEAVLRLIDLGVADVERFPFITPPHHSRLQAALRELTQLGAIDGQRRLTAVGREMVPYPLSPPLARMVVEAAMRHPEALDDTIWAAATLSGRNPWIYPPGSELLARKAHRRWHSADGDMVSLVKLARAFADSPNKREFCQRNFVDEDTLSLIAKAHSQLWDIASERGCTQHNRPAAVAAFIACLAVAFKDKCLRRVGRIYRSAQGVNAAIQPSSALFLQQPRFILATELFAAARTYAVNVSPLDKKRIMALFPDVARRWLQSEAPRAAPLEAGAKLPVAAPPSHLTLGPLQVPIAVRRGKLSVRLSYDEALALQRHLRQAGERGAVDIPPRLAQARCTLLSEVGPCLYGKLPYVLALLGEVPLSCKPHPFKKPLPLGVLLQADAHIHILSRHLPALLQPYALLRRKKTKTTSKGGYLALVTNYQEGFWFDLLPGFTEAVYTTEESLQALGNLPGSIALGQAFTQATAEVVQWSRKIASAKQAPRPRRKRGAAAPRS